MRPTFGSLLDESVAYCGIEKTKLSCKEQQEFEGRVLKQDEEDIGTMC